MRAKWRAIPSPFTMLLRRGVTLPDAFARNSSARPWLLCIRAETLPYHCRGGTASRRRDFVSWLRYLSLASVMPVVVVWGAATS